MVTCQECPAVMLRPSLSRGWTEHTEHLCLDDITGGGNNSKAASVCCSGRNNLLERQTLPRVSSRLVPGLSVLVYLYAGQQYLY